MATVVVDWLAEFDRSLQAQDLDAVVEQFDDACYWRDLLTFTHNIRTEEGKDAIREMLEARLADTKPSAFKIDGQATETSDGILEAFFTFETSIARGRGYLRLKANTGKALNILTTMEELKGFEEKKVN